MTRMWTSMYIFTDKPPLKGAMGWALASEREGVCCEVVFFDMRLVLSCHAASFEKFIAIIL